MQVNIAEMRARIKRAESAGADRYNIFILDSYLRLIEGTHNSKDTISEQSTREYYNIFCKILIETEKPSVG